MLVNKEYKHLYLSLYGAYLEGESRHAQQIIKSLGITYEKAVPQSLGDCWQFFNVSNVPEELPDYMNIFNSEPLDFVGFGLSEEEATKLTKIQDVKGYLDEKENLRKGKEYQVTNKTDNKNIPVYEYNVKDMAINICGVEFDTSVPDYW